MEQIEGRNPVKEALRAGAGLERIVCAKGSQRGLKDILQLADSVGIKIEWQKRYTKTNHTITCMVPNNRHTCP